MLSQGVCVGDVMSSPLPLRQTGTTKKGMPFLFSRMAAVFPLWGKKEGYFSASNFSFYSLCLMQIPPPPDKCRMHCIIPLKARSVRCPGKNFRTCNPYLSGSLFPLWEVTARYIRAEGWEPVISCDSPELLRGKLLFWRNKPPWKLYCRPSVLYRQLSPAGGNPAPPSRRPTENDPARSRRTERPSAFFLPGGQECGRLLYSGLRRNAVLA